MHTYNLFIFKDGNIIHELKNVIHHEVDGNALCVSFYPQAGLGPTVIPNHAYDYATPEEEDR